MSAAMDSGGDTGHAGFLPAVLAALSLLMLLSLSGCGGSKQPGVGGGDYRNDGAPARRISAADVKDAKPRSEPRARYGNHSPYKVNGKTYRVKKSAKGYRKKGVASWYGRQFHGRPTSSGEKFDMYQATAAHKSLPLPTYAKVTNLDNGRTVVVKINDRGPFVDDRLIDLSYGAAVRLGMISTGTARVEVKAIVPSGAAEDRLDNSKGRVYLQVGVFSNKDSAARVEKRLSRANIKPVSVYKGRISGKKVFRVWVGPVKTASEFDRKSEQVMALGLGRPIRVSR